MQNVPINNQLLNYYRSINNDRLQNIAQQIMSNPYLYVQPQAPAYNRPMIQDVIRSGILNQNIPQQSALYNTDNAQGVPNLVNAYNRLRGGYNPNGIGNTNGFMQ